MSEKRAKPSTKTTPPGRDYEFLSGRKGPLGEARVYTSPVDEWRRLIKYRRTLHTFAVDRDAVWTALISVIQTIYRAPGKDFSVVGTKINFRDLQLKVHFYDPGREISFRGTSNQKVAHNVAFVLRRNFLTRRINVHFSDQAVAPRTLFGLKDTVAKWVYRRNAAHNARLFATNLREKLKEAPPATLPDAPSTEA